MGGQDGLRADADVHLCCSATAEGPFAHDRTSIFPPSCCVGCGGRGVGFAAAGRAEAWPAATLASGDSPEFSN